MKIKHFLIKTNRQLLINYEFIHLLLEENILLLIDFN